MSDPGQDAEELFGEALDCRRSTGLLSSTKRAGDAPELLLSREKKPQVHSTTLLSPCFLSQGIFVKAMS
jgi:hypothetical protein